RPRRDIRHPILRGDVPSPINPPTGCRFHTRCPYAEEVCRVHQPPLREMEPGHTAACHFAGQRPSLFKPPA
ncbi:MAG: peptide ABC transporter substrate-binding protein, partial [bacterium]